MNDHEQNDLLVADYYIAPEVYKDEIFDRRVDVHSFGVILYEVHLLILLSFFLLCLVFLQYVFFLCVVR